MKPNAGPRVFRGGKARGRLLGGNLNTLSGLLGSPYCPSLEAAILFLEESDKSLAEFERGLSQLAVQGAFEQLAGVLVGKLEKIRGESNALDRFDLLREVLGANDMPVLVDVDLGHTSPMTTLPLGLEVEIDTSGPSLCIAWSPAKSGDRG